MQKEKRQQKNGVEGGKLVVHDVEVNYFTCSFTCGFTCNIFYFTCELYAYVFTCATSKVISQVKLHVKPQVKSFISTSCSCNVITVYQNG